MNYTEKYELREISKFRSYDVIGEYYNETEGMEALNEMGNHPGVFHLVRLTEVIIGSRIKA